MKLKFGDMSLRELFLLVLAVVLLLGFAERSLASGRVASYAPETQFSEEGQHAASFPESSGASFVSTQKVPKSFDFVQGEVFLLSGSPLYEELASLSLDTPATGHVIVHSSGTITQHRSGTYVDVGISINDDPPVWANRAGTPDVGVEGPLSWPFSVAHIFEVPLAGEHTFSLNARQMERDGPVMVEMGSMYAQWIAPAGAKGK